MTRIQGAHGKKKVDLGGDESDGREDCQGLIRWRRKGNRVLLTVLRGDVMYEKVHSDCCDSVISV